jgi:hypothetical protein
VISRGQTAFTSLDTAIAECDRRAGQHAIYSVILGGVLVVVVLAVLFVIASLVVQGPLQKVTFKDGDKESIYEPITPAIFVLLPTLAIIAAFLASLSRFHLRTMSRWDDYGIAFARIKLATRVPPPSIPEVGALLAAPFAAIGTPPDLEMSKLIEILEKLSTKPPK